MIYLKNEGTVGVAYRSCAASAVASATSTTLMTTTAAVEKAWEESRQQQTILFLLDVEVGRGVEVGFVYLSFVHQILLKKRKKKKYQYVNDQQSIRLMEWIENTGDQRLE